jgi:UPF0755 protein
MRKMFIRLFLLILLVGGGAAAYFFYKKFMGPIKLDKGYTYIFIENGDDLTSVMEELKDEGISFEDKSFLWLSKKMDLDKNLHPGKYRINAGMNLRQVINLIKYGKEEKIKLSYNSQIHNLEEFIEYTADKLEMNENEIEEYLSDERKLSDAFGLDPDNAFALIIPGSYEVSWAISTEDLFALLRKRFKEIWNDKRKALARKASMEIPAIIALASIVQGESAIESEQEKIAGVYVNRLNKGMPLQADPTLIFATKKFDAKRVYDVDKEINSPYNTYKYKGLPPGPISLVNVQALDATLNYTRHTYIFFCAKPELNGYSDFTSNYNEHMKCAAAYQRAMNKKGIK